MSLFLMIAVFILWFVWHIIRIRRDNEMRRKLNSKHWKDREEAEGYYLGFWGAALVTLLIIVALVLLRFLWPVMVVIGIIWLIKVLIAA